MERKADLETRLLAQTKRMEKWLVELEREVVALKARQHRDEDAIKEVLAEWSAEAGASTDRLQHRLDRLEHRMLELERRVERLSDLVVNMQMRGR
jgi:uncharacterized coiled-coil protein SlyX